MGRVWTIFRKELKDTLRDKRTILMMVVIPLLMVPLLIGLVVWVQKSQQEKAEAKRLKIVFLGREFAPQLYRRFEEDERFQLMPEGREEELAEWIAAERIEGAVVVPADFAERVERDQQARIRILFRSTDSFGISRRRLEEVIEEYDRGIVEARIRRLGVDKDLFDAIRVEPLDVASTQERLGKTLGGMLPYMFILFAFMGAMYPGIDLGAGEKERGTLETLLSTPASRLEIVLGKFLVVMLAALLSAVISMAGLYLGTRAVTEIPAEFLQLIRDLLSAQVVLLLLSLLLPLAVFFAAAILSISIYARSFKEAQSMVTPLNFVVIVPVLIGLMPGVEFTPATALIPILNVSLATKEVLAGTIRYGDLALVYLSLFLLSALSILFCVKWFERESVIFRD